MKKKIAHQPSLSLSKNRINELENIAKSEEQKAIVLQLKNDYFRLSILSDRFNEKFSSRGWIAYESLSGDVMEKALTLAKNTSLSKAEEYLIGYYDKGTVEKSIEFLWGVKPFRDRIRLIKLAYDDFIFGRYYSCIPILLMMIDGVVADASNNVSFFSSKSDLVSWDSIAGHDTGLQVIKDILFKTRGLTNKSKITLPYRNGIMHGRDLGYDNREVAAKCWALLFAVRDLLAAKRDEKDRKQKFEIESAKNMDDIQQDMKRLADMLMEVSIMDTFKRKPVLVGIDYPVSGIPDNYLINSPERAVVEFLFFWQKKNYGSMSHLIYRPEYITKSKMAGIINSIFQNKSIDSFRFIKSEDLSSCKVDISLKAVIAFKDLVAEEYDLNFRVLYSQIESVELVVNPSKAGQWKIANDFTTINQIGTPLEWLSESNDPNNF